MSVTGARLISVCPSRDSDEEEEMKKIAMLCLLVVATVLLTLTFAGNFGSRAAAAPPPHPHIHEALESMRGAKHHLESAEHDFEGHKVKAIERLDMAIHEAEICESMR